MQYRLRQLVTVNGTEYWCYWLKLIDFSGSNIAVSKVNTTTGEETPYELDNEEIVVKYTRNKKVTKEQFEDLKQKITEIYPWAKDYYPEYMDDLCK